MATFGYPGRWQQLIVGRNSEYIVHAMLARIAAKLSSNHGIRLSVFKPDLDIDLTDLLIRLETRNWILYIQVQVRARQSGSIQLGKVDSYGTISAWAAEAAKSGVPIVLFVLGNGNKMDFYETRKLRRVNSRRASVPAPTKTIGQVESSFTEFVLNICSYRNTLDAQRAISQTVHPHRAKEES